MGMLIDVSGLADFTPYEGLGTSALLKQDGFYKVLLAKLVAGKSKTGNEKFTISCVVQDEDEKGQTLIADLTFGGADKNGKPMIRRLGDLLVSAGMSLDAVRALAARGQLDVDQLVPLLTGKVAHIEAEAQEYDGRMTTRVQNFVPPERYNTSVSAGAHRRPHKPVQAFTGTPAGATATALPAFGAGVAMPSAAAIATTPKNGATSAALDLLGGMGL